MANTIIDLWYGNIAPSEYCGAHDPEIKRVLDSMERNRETLWDSLTAAQKETFQKYIDCTEKHLLRMVELSFCDGYSLGSKLAMEALL